MIADRVAAVRDRIARAAARAARKADKITLVAVSKTHPTSSVREAYEAGLRDFGENKVQEAEAKVRAFAGADIHWHLIGHLQSNKARKAVDLFDTIQSVDEAPLALRLERLAAEAKKKLRVLVQVDVADEATKFGLDPERLFPLLEQLRGVEFLSVEGLMGLPPYEVDPERVRPFFHRLRDLRDEALQRGLLQGGHLSMGMSHDLEVAIEEGATIVRVGTAIFGERPAG